MTKSNSELIREAEREKERLDVIVSLSANVIFEYDISTDRMCYYNKSEEEEWKEPKKHFTVEILENNRIHEDDYGVLVTFCEQLKAGEKQIRLEMRKKFKDGVYHWIEVSAKTIYNQKGQPEKVIGKVGIVDDRIRYRNEWTWRMERDRQTGLYNKETVKKLIMQKLEQAESFQEKYLIVIDVSGFYAKKDKLISDIMLCTFTDELQIQFPESCVGRIGEKELIVYTENISTKEIRKIQKDLNKHIQRIYKEAGRTSVVLCSMGISQVGRASTYEKLLQEARSALYHGQQAGGLYIYKEQQTPIIPPIKDVSSDETYTNIEQRTDSDLVLFAIELFEKVQDTKDVLRVLSDRICKLYKMQDIVYISFSKEEGIQVTYRWGSRSQNEFKKIYLDEAREEWDILLRQHDEAGISVLREKDVVREEDYDGRSILSIHLGEEKKDYYMLFVDRDKDREWKEEQHTLRRLAWIMHKHLSQMEQAKKEQERTNYIIEHDDKTELYNYTKFLTMAERMVRENKNKKYALIYSDFSNFQFLNETYGYVTGDKVLIDFASALKENCPSGVLHSRVTGDHFVSMHEYQEEQELVEEYVQFCNNFCDKVNKKYNMCNLLLISGMCVIDDPKVKIAVYVDNANIARKTAKKGTLTKCKVFSEDMRFLSKKHMDMVANMEKALQNGEFTMFLQPKIHLETGKISGAEALVRWIKADGTIICPDEFIPLFEKNGFITRIDFEMLRQVLELQHSILEQKKQLIPISVNFSRRHQENVDYVEKMHSMMQQYQVPSEYVEIEVTESVFMEDFTVLNRNISQLKKKGVLISIDDFGSGYSSLNVLSKVDADVIKLDRQFLLDMEADKQEVKTNFLNTLVLMIKQLGFRVLAEGVETKEQEAILKNIGCEFAQGFLYAKPMPVNEFIEFFGKFEQDKLFLQ